MTAPTHLADVDTTDDAPTGHRWVRIEFYGALPDGQPLETSLETIAAGLHHAFGFPVIESVVVRYADGDEDELADRLTITTP